MLSNFKVNLFLVTNSSIGTGCKTGWLFNLSSIISLRSFTFPTSPLNKLICSSIRVNAFMSLADKSLVSPVPNRRRELKFSLAF
ncbi:hypothetical protein DICPUDRAFT_158655 [Dictyostelium purpureum]|uniref:Uncharacterized protein n=1 Tax=Dictyostelium purpureum TaxID=5786 RepID=F1A255_DICPU|nr:uncharacterized protein DICPUDRAFT_158655 [Dictyostelium purpureum]EGC29727.1 hypothetical protein DICPUDRAFT_158655 [Dictyostelium purpureum]|eukprot:XP_003293753.1 hypothetical protein DICPUDRAFT_158655 [Dictyostelium purpureum]